MCEYLLENAGVVGMPGSAYGEETACCMRFSFANATEDLERAARKITDALLKLPAKVTIRSGGSVQINDEKNKRNGGFPYGKEIRILRRKDRRVAACPVHAGGYACQYHHWRRRIGPPHRYYLLCSGTGLPVGQG